MITYDFLGGHNNVDSLNVDSHNVNSQKLVFVITHKSTFKLNMSSLDLIPSSRSRRSASARTLKLPLSLLAFRQF